MTSLFSEEPVQIILLHAHSALRTKEFLISIEDIIEKDIRLKLEKEADGVKARWKNGNLEIIFAYEQTDIISAITSNANKFSADLLVVGTEENESWNDVSYREEGRTANIVKEVEIPTLIVPVERNAERPKNFLFATLPDGIRGENDVKPLKELMKICGAHLDVVTVGSEDSSRAKLGSELRTTINGYLNGLDFSYHALLDSDTYNAIEHFSHDHENDLVCIIYRKHGILERLLKPSVSKKVLSRSNRPILALKRNE